MAKTRYFLHDEEIPEAEALTPEGVIRDGVTMRTSRFMRDGWPGFTLRDASGAKLPAEGGRAGYVFSSDASAVEQRAEAYAVSKAALSSRYKGGLGLGDTLNYQGRTLVADAQDGSQLTFHDIKSLDGDELKQQAYDESVARMTDAWRRDEARVGPVAGEACTVGGRPGVWKRLNGSWVCDPEANVSGQRVPSDMEHELAGPLSDSGQSVRDAAYEASVRNLENAWRR